MVEEHIHRDAWGIYLGLTDFAKQTGDPPHDLAGFGFFGWDAPAHASGITIALFRTRAAARKALASRFSIKDGWPRAKVVRVEVTLRWGA